MFSESVNPLRSNNVYVEEVSQKLKPYHSKGQNIKSTGRNSCLLTKSEEMDYQAINVTFAHFLRDNVITSQEQTLD